jgi:hypothetical protein
MERERAREKKIFYVYIDKSQPSMHNAIFSPDCAGLIDFIHEHSFTLTHTHKQTQIHLKR